jgi:Prokaryotic Cytochrome C oxidase subunit IV
MSEVHPVAPVGEEHQPHSPYMTVFYTLLNLTLMEYWYAYFHGTSALPFYMLVTAGLLSVVTYLGSKAAGIKIGMRWLYVALIPAVLLSLIHVPLLLGLLILAITKANLVGLFFMHLKYEGNWVYMMLIPAAFLAMVLIIGLTPDIAGQKEVPGLSLELMDTETSALASPSPSRQVASAPAPANSLRANREGSSRRQSPPG